MLSSMFIKKETKILVCDNSKLTLPKLQHFLESQDYTVLHAKNDAEALYSFATQMPDAIILSDAPPHINGIELTKKIVSMLDHPDDVPIILLTDLDSSTSIAAALSAGAYDYMARPFDFTTLNQRLSRLLAPKIMQRDLINTTKFTNSIVENAADSIVTVDKHGDIIYLNPSAQKLFSFFDIKETEKNINKMFHKLFINHAQTVDINSLVNGTYETECLSFDGSYIPVEFSVTEFLIDDDIHHTIILKDISDRKEYEARIRQHAFYDSLTGLPNRVLLKERFDVEINRARRTKTQLAIIHVDLDRFKIINDTMGHSTGDELLQAVSKRMLCAIRKDDFIARIGGDEFLILIPGLHNDEHIGKVATNVLQSINKPFSINNFEINITGSIGISICPDDGQDQETLITNADIALYRSKESGKNEFKTYTPELSTKALARMEMEYDLRKAVDNQEFVVYYQPKVSTVTETIIGMEALVRWIHPKHGLVPPNDFIPLAEETGIILKIGDWVLKEACIHNKRLQEEGFDPIIVSVNLSMKQFEQKDFVDSIISTLEETGLSPEYLDLEITESIAMLDIDNTVRIIKSLQAYGVHFSIDDFGTGYSSLSQLGKLTVDKLKIDKSFISNMEHVKSDSIIASTILALGKNLNMKIVAEGVENLEHVAFLKENLCDEMQGYYYGKPMTIENFTSLLKQKNLRR
ncbi:MULTISPECIES: EAL domain-containing protein [unclassified Fusibacter]|uniref:EAL domain-containing protein n=1 Tax=unclassified Fusibacter TaxID=2624464 RepID=UPI0010136615|nr:MULTISPECIES: EAL domain-containing protein [unclassified Fusibacter]MCK8060449.1 EAL domain-containing protein [Fusibacter sp. A2]NPE20262.1 GGDEF domain-containing response regulator [Fusibacter sp. A1]RXV63469.1 GGDEF domain-containing response regulator [Fusibacter sp. A1]